MANGVQFQMSIQPSAALSRAYEIAPHVVIDEMTRSTWEAEFLLEREIKELTPVGIGGGAGLKGSISSQEPAVLANNVIGMVGTALSYAVPVELGTRPHMPPVQPLADWAEHKLGVQHDDALGVGFLIARKIAIKGTEGAFMFERGFKANEPQVRRIYTLGAERVVERIEAGK